MRTLVLMRHGESTANVDGTFAGWLDVPLTAAGVAQARTAGRLLREAGLEFDICYTSVLRRAIHSAWHCLDAMERTWLPVERSWRLNERHYGALQGLDKARIAATHGEEQVRLWRRSYYASPPAACAVDPRTGHDERYAAVARRELPLTESMHDAELRVLPFWRETIAPQLACGRRPLVVAHGTTLRAFARILTGTSGSAVEEMEVPNGVPAVYELDEEGRPQRIHFCSPRPSSENRFTGGSLPTGSAHA